MKLPATLVHPAQKLHQCLSADIPLVPSVWDALGALIARKAGAKAGYLSGFCLAASQGRRDVGLTNASEMVQRVWDMSSATDLPVIVDADQGFGGSGNAIMTFKALERAGAAAVQFEDQIFPKRSASYAGIGLISADQMAERLGMIASVRTTPTLIIGRTDSLASEGIDEAVRRLKLYQGAGADLLMPMGPKTDEDFSALAKAFPRRWILVLSEAAKITPVRPLEEFRVYQPAMVIYSSSLLRRYARVMQRSVEQMLRDGYATMDSEAMFGQEDMDAIMADSQHPLTNT